MLARLATVFYGAALVTLPWSGVGLLTLTTGRDWGGGLQPSWLFLGCAIFLAGIDGLRQRSLGFFGNNMVPPGVRRWWLLGSLGVLLSVAVSVVGLWLAPSGESLEATLGRFIKQVIQLVVMISFTVWPALWTRGAQRWSWTVKLLLVGGIFQLGYGVLQGFDYFHSLGLYDWLDGVFTSNPSILSGSEELYLGNSFRHVPRLRGTICEPLYLGNFLLFLWPLLLIPVWKSGTRRFLAAAFLLLLLGTWSRGAWLALVGQAVLMGGMVLGYVKKSGRGLSPPAARNIRFLILGVVALTAVVPLVGWVAGWEGFLFPYRRLAQTFSGQDWSNLTRLYSMQAAWRAFLLSPIFGIGWGQFGWHFPALVDPMGLQSQFTWPVVNNFPLLVLCETGLVGFLVWVAWGVGLVRAVVFRFGAIFSQPAFHLSFDFSTRILVGTTVSAAGVWLQLLTFSQYNLPHIWLSLGLVLAILADRDPTPGSGWMPETGVSQS